MWLSSFFGEPGLEVDGILSQVVPGNAGLIYTFSGWSRWEPNYSAQVQVRPIRSWNWRFLIAIAMRSVVRFYSIFALSRRVITYGASTYSMAWRQQGRQASALLR